VLIYKGSASKWQSPQPLLCLYHKRPSLKTKNKKQKIMQTGATIKTTTKLGRKEGRRKLGGKKTEM
jgi:hypothetical protein